MRLQARFHQFLEHGRRAGFASAVKMTFYRCEEAVPVEKDLSLVKEPTPPAAEPDLRLVEIGPENFDDVDWTYPLESRKTRAQSYFARGYRSFALARGDRIVGDVWYVTAASAKTSVIHPHVGAFSLDFGPKDVYMFDMHVAQDERGKALATYFMQSVLWNLRERGFRRAFGYFAAGNVPALWVHRLLGFRERPRVFLRRFIFYESARPKEGTGGTPTAVPPG